jgi:hypothetical protein
MPTAEIEVVHITAVLGAGADAMQDEEVHPSVNQ